MWAGTRKPNNLAKNRFSKICLFEKVKLSFFMWCSEKLGEKVFTSFTGEDGGRGVKNYEKWQYA